MGFSTLAMQMGHRDRNWFGLFTLPLTSGGVRLCCRPWSLLSGVLLKAAILPQEECKRGDLTCDLRGPEKRGRERETWIDRPAESKASFPRPDQGVALSLLWCLLCPPLSLFREGSLHVTKLYM